MGEKIYNKRTTQPHMAKGSNAPKYHLLTAEKIIGGNQSRENESQVSINIFTGVSYVNSPSAAWDTVSMISDVSSTNMVHH